MPVDDQVKRMMEELGRALARTMRTSSDVSETVRKINHQGFVLHVVLSCEPDEDLDRRSSRNAEKLPRQGLSPSTSARQVRSGNIRHEPKENAGEAPTRRRDPEYRLNGRDVGFLESLGIAATRRPGRRSSGRRRRSS